MTTTTPVDHRTVRVGQTILDHFNRPREIAKHETLPRTRRDIQGGLRRIRFVFTDGTEAIYGGKVQVVDNFCPTCDGDGEIDCENTKCPQCGGSGITTPTEPRS